MVRDSANVTINYYYNVLHALSVGPKINDLGSPWTAVPHSNAHIMCILELTMEIWNKTDPYYQQNGVAQQLYF